MEGKQDRLQAQQLAELAANHFIQQEVEGATHGAECLDLIWTNNSDLISSCEKEDWSQFSDPKLIIAHTTYSLCQDEAQMEEQFLCETSRR